MKIELTYKYSELDKKHQFGIKTTGDEYSKTYINWVWFYLGMMLPPRVNYTIYPLNLNDGVLIKEYVFANDAQRQATFIVTRIKTKLKEK